VFSWQSTQELLSLLKFFCWSMSLVLSLSCKRV
jgi:hypothetical protein